MEDFSGKDEWYVVQQLRLVASNFKPVALYKEIFSSYAVDGRVSFMVGRQHGQIDLTAKECGLNLIEVGAREWQNKMHLAGYETMKAKPLSLKTAVALLPGVDWRGLTLKTGKPTKGPHMGRVDAALIALYGLTMFREENPELFRSGAV